MKKIIFLLTSLYSFSYSAGTYDTYYFTDYEENASLYFLNYYDNQDFVNIGLTTADASAIQLLRPITSLSVFASNANFTGTDLLKIRCKSHIIDWNIYTDALGLTLTQTNFLFGLSGVLFGFTFLIIMLSFVSGRK